MAINRRFLYIIITILLMAAAISAAIFSAPHAHAEDEGTKSCALSYVNTEGDDVTYYCFDNAQSVFADGEVTLIAGQSGIYSIYDNVDGKKEILLKNTPADKVYHVAKHERDSEYLIVLRNGRLGTMSEDNGLAWLNINGEINDFCVLNDTVYAISSERLTVAPLTDGGINEQDIHTLSLVSDRHSAVSAKRITAAGGKLYISVKAVFGNKWDVCSADVSGMSGAVTCKLDTALNQSNDILSITASAQTDMVYMLTRSEIIGYNTVGGWLYKACATDGGDITDIYACGNEVYAIDTLNALHVLNSDLTEDKTIIASAGAADGFFNIPFGMTAKQSTLYAADTGNNRIAVYNNNGLSYIDRTFGTPVSVAADNAGTLYVAYDYNKVGIFHNSAYSPYDEITISSDLFGRIRQIAVDIDKTLFIVTDSGLWNVGSDYIPHRLNTTAYKAIALSIGKSNLYALDNNNNVVLINKKSGEVITTRPVAAGGISIAVDLNDTAFVLYDNRIESVTTENATAQYPLTLNGKRYTLGEKTGQIMLCFMEDRLSGDNCENHEHNYLLILDTFRHRILQADGNTVGARFVDYSYESPDIAGNTTAAAAQKGIVHKVRFDTPLFNYPIETKSDYTIAAGSSVLMPVYRIVAPDYDPDETPEFALVLVDDTQNNRLIQGYVYKDALSEPLPYTAPPSEICTITGELGTIVYKWPSRNSVAVDGYAETAKNTKFTMLDFVSSFRDGYGYYWYRIALTDGKEGYVPAVNISTIDYQQANILPDYNAEIIEYNGKNYAKVYTLSENGKDYTEILDVTLKAGTKVEVVGAFDSSERYTQIKYLDEKSHKTVTCYVETVHVKYTGLNIVLIVALLVIAITVILAIIIITRVYYSKKKRLDNDDENNKDTD